MTGICTLQELDNCGGTSLGSGGGHSDAAGGYMPTLTQVLEFIHQCKQTNLTKVSGTWGLQQKAVNMCKAHCEALSLIMCSRYKSCVHKHCNLTWGLLHSLFVVLAFSPECVDQIPS